MPRMTTVVAARRSTVSDEHRLHVVFGRAVRAGNDHLSPDPEKVSSFIGFAEIERNPAPSSDGFRRGITDILDASG